MNSAHMAAWTNRRPAKAAPGAHERGSELPGHRPKAAMTFPEDHTGELDLADRHALRRVAGLSTELTDVTEVEYRALRLERVVLIGVWTDGTLAGAENSLRELSRLAETAGSVVLDCLVQRRRGRVAVPAGGRPGGRRRWHRYPRARRNQDRDRPAPDPGAHGQAAAPDRGDVGRPRGPARAAAPPGGAGRGHHRLHQRGKVEPAQRSDGGRSPGR